MQTTQPQRLLAVTPFLLACLIQTTSLLAQTQKQTDAKTENGTIHIRIEKEENGRKKVIERTYKENDLLKGNNSRDAVFSMDSLNLPDMDILNELDMLESDDLRKQIPPFMEGYHRELLRELRAQADRLQEFPPVPTPPHPNVHVQPFPPAELTERFFQSWQPTRFPMEFDEEHYDIQEQKTEKGRSIIITPKPETDDKNDRSASLKIMQVKLSSDQGVFDVQFYLAQKGDVTLVVRNTAGKEVVKEKIKDAEGEYIKSIDLGKQPKGIYFITLTQNNDGVVKRIVVE